MLSKVMVTILFCAFTSNVMAMAEYNSEKNVVRLISPANTEDINIGAITIYNEKYIEIKGFRWEKGSDKVISMCGKDPSLGLLFLNNNIKLGAKKPKVTEVRSEPNSNEEDIKAGWVDYFVLKDDDALDLMDLLYENQSVGFAIYSEQCAETIKIKPGTIVINFETRGIERAMKRLK